MSGPEFRVVIGANFGDEGKGATVDWLAREAHSRGRRVTVARYSGGCQAGHTVVTPGGARHVFCHIGSGAFVPDAETFLMRNFVVNPLMFQREFTALHETIQAYGLSQGPDHKHRVLVDSRCRVTTPFDMLINQWHARSRGAYDTCGMGLNETKQRSHDPRFILKVSDLPYKNRYEERMRLIREVWVPGRMAELGISHDDESLAELAIDWESRFEESVQFFCDNVLFANQNQVTERTIGTLGTWIFESSQGLGLDAKIGKFPFVTHSTVGLKVVEKFLGGLTGDKDSMWEVPVYFCTRGYLTRHGDGPMYESTPKTLEHGFTVQDPTNQPNDWQGEMRTGPLDLEEMEARIDAAYSQLSGDGYLEFEPRLSLTHADMAGKEIRWFLGREEVVGTIEELLRDLREKVVYSFPPNDLVWYGPSSKHARPGNEVPAPEEVAPEDVHGLNAAILDSVTAPNPEPKTEEEERLPAVEAMSQEELDTILGKKKASGKKASLSFVDDFGSYSSRDVELLRKLREYRDRLSREMREVRVDGLNIGKIQW